MAGFVDGGDSGEAPSQSSNVVLPQQAGLFLAPVDDMSAQHGRNESQDIDFWIRSLEPLEDSLAAGIGIVGTRLRDALGPDPFLIAPTPSSTGERWTVLLRASDEVAVLDDRFEITKRLPAPPDPSSWTWVDSNIVLVGGESSGRIACYLLDPAFSELARIDLPARSVRGVAFDPASRIAFALDPIADRAFAIHVDESGRLTRHPQLDLELSPGPLHAIFAEGRLITNSLLGHTIQVFGRSSRTDGGSVPGTPAPGVSHAKTMPGTPAPGVSHARTMPGTPAPGVGHRMAEHSEVDGSDAPWKIEASAVHDGPIWSIDAVARGDTLWIAAGGVEDHPLDRTGGEFGNVDSYLFLYRSVRTQTGGSGELVRLAEWNLSAVGVVTPKRVRFDEASRSIWISGFGSEHVLRVPFHDGSDDPARWFERSLVLASPPGITDFVIDRHAGRLVATTSLLDGIAILPFLEGRDVESPPYTFIPMPTAIATAIESQTLSGSDTHTYSGSRSDSHSGSDSRSDSHSRSHSHSHSHSHSESDSDSASTSAPASILDSDTVAELRLGELLTFTTLLTPGNRSDGSLSRFTCEACHFEGGVDGRTHFTGREHVFATTKTVRGLGHNTPLFSRSGASSLAEMVPAEFQVANQDRSDRHWILAEEHPWMRSIPALSSRISPETQRRGMTRYLFELPVIPHPGRSSNWTELEKEGLQVFRARCSSCHLPLRTTRNEQSLVPFEDWATWLSSPDSDLIWGAPFLIKTGVTPYVSPAGARVPSLRRARWKRPHFTNGSAHSIEEVLERFRYNQVMGWHGPPDGASRADVEELTSTERAALLSLFERF